MQQETVQILPENMLYACETKTGNENHKSQSNLTTDCLSFTVNEVSLLPARPSFKLLGIIMHI